MTSIIMSIDKSFTDVKRFNGILQSLNENSLVVIYCDKNFHYDTPVKASQLFKMINTESTESKEEPSMILTYHDTNYDDSTSRPVGVYLTSNNIRDRQKFAINTSNMLMINSYQGLKRMVSQYSVNGKISWQKISDQYYGIYISNLKNKPNSNPLLAWYYNLWPADVECCIWNLNCVVKKLDKANVI